MTSRFDTFVYSILDESYTNNDNFHSWLAPNGDIYPVTSAKSHGDWADDYLRSKGFDTSKIKKYDSIIDTMFKNGWCRVTKYGDTIYIHKTGTPPTKYSLRNIIDNCIQNNMQFIKLDNETDMDRVLWANDDY